ncbi:helix-turn-helix transcriptional regulator [Myroides sp. JBRI-B21084]|uniref:helix-turn-helix domain-containing protein n=1 Tax=Myroides sp. JBRI-B21084 TaxID=3119977 RepID=UPI0026E365E8|nr:helix-turn-helix transcriptional regulator [Paenimyroides cloacae]WKW46767.1 helix-turn-helix transcriptional regulator [Paenimyroides cloacae]
MKFSAQLQKVMQHFGLTTTEMADKINVPKATISHLISERNKPSLEFIMKVHTTFPTLNLEWLIYGKEPFLANSNQPENNETNHTPTLNFDETFKDTIINTQQTITQNNLEPNLFETELSKPIQNENISEKMSNNVENVLSFDAQKIDSIVIFYSNGSFKQYKP